MISMDNGNIFINGLKGNLLSNTTLGETLVSNYEGESSVFNINVGNLKINKSKSNINATIDIGSVNINNIQGTLDPGEIETYIATYLISNSAALTGILSNTVQVKGSFGGQVNNIVDISDDGDDTDGNTNDDPTIVEVSFEVGNASIEVTKVAQITDNGDNEVEAGDIVTYDITVENTGEVTLKDLTIEDILTDGNGSNLVLSNGPFYAGSTMNSNSGTILPGETANYIAFYIIEQRAADTGKIVNSVIATASTASDTTITDTSDDGDDNDGNVKDDPTEVFIAPRPGVEVEKTAQITDNGDGKIDFGDIITYTCLLYTTDAADE